MKVRLLVVALVAMLTPALVMATPAAAATATRTLTFDELPSPTPANQLHTGGVKFGFKVAGAASTDATYGGSGPGSTKFTTDPILEGNAAGTLTLTFDRPTKLLAFGLALATHATLNPGFTVNLFDHTGAPLGTFPVLTKNRGFFFSEARFNKKLATAIKKAVITFDGADAPRFALDNLTFKVTA